MYKNNLRGITSGYASGSNNVVSYTLAVYTSHLKDLLKFYILFL